MIPVIEQVLSQTIQAQLKYLQANVDIVDSLFPQATTTARSRLKTYLQSNGINVLQAWPRDVSSLPSYVILLGGEQEQDQVLGDYIGDSDEFTTKETTETQTIFSNSGLLFVEVNNKPLSEVVSITYGGMTFDSEFTIADEDRGIVALNFPVDLLNNDSCSITYQYKETGTEEYGSFFRSQYRIEAWTANNDLTILLYHLLKWFMLINRAYLAQQGLAVQRLGGADLEPAPEYFPEFVYRRALTFDCEAQVSYPATYEFIQSITTNQTLTEEG